MGKNRKHTKSSLLAAIRSAAKTRKGRRLSLQQFQVQTKISPAAIYRYFPSWTAATTAAGFSWLRYNQVVNPGTLLGDWADSIRKLGHIPSHFEHRAHGKYHPATIAKRCGGWDNLPATFRKFAADKDEWTDVLALLPPPGTRPATFRAPPRNGERIYGAPLDFKSLRHAPVNEMGVVCLFSLMAADLGFIIESVHGAFPDCEAKRCTAPGEWRLRRIEFEFESRNFLLHHHPPEGCDIIVCWNHNWPDCPVEVIELSKEIDRQKSSLERA